MGSAEAMVTARMSREKKKLGNSVLSDLGMNASSAINQLYDYLIEQQCMPFGKESEPARSFTQEEVDAARLWVDGLRMPAGNPLADLTLKEAKRHRLSTKGFSIDEVRA